jgi:hypothetical protein
MKAVALLPVMLWSCSAQPAGSDGAPGADLATDATGGEAGAGVDAGADAGDAAVTPAVGVIWRGLGFAWKKTSHRLNKLGALVELSGTSTVKATATMEGGSWSTGQRASDQADYEVAYSAVKTRAARFAEGTFKPLLVKGDAKSSPEVVAQTSRQERISLSTAGLADAKQVAILLRGFSVDTDVTHKDGYTTRGLTVRLAKPTRRPGSSTLASRARPPATPPPCNGPST